MPSHIVIKRLVDDREYMPGEVIVDMHGPNAQVLVDRGYLQEVGDDFAQRHADATTEAGARATIPGLVARGFSEKAARHLAETEEAKWPKYVQDEKTKVEAREARVAERTEAEINRLATLTGGTADDIIDLSDEEYKELLDENPSPAPVAAADAATIGSGEPSTDTTTAFDALMAMPKEGLLENMAERSIPEPTDPDWFKNDNLREGVVRTILDSAGYSGAAVEPGTQS